jgi:hypothetical protein
VKVTENVAVIGVIQDSVTRKRLVLQPVKSVTTTMLVVQRLVKYSALTDKPAVLQAGFVVLHRKHVKKTQIAVTSNVRKKATAQKSKGREW